MRGQRITQGAGVVVQTGSPTLRGNLIFRNTILGSGRATGAASGVGVFIGERASPRIEGNVFNENSIRGASVQRGAAIAIQQGGAEIVGNRFFANSLSAADSDVLGVGISVERSRAVILIASNVFHGNDARDAVRASGGAIGCYRADRVTVVNNTVVNNRLPSVSRSSSGAAFFFERSRVAVHNNILAFNVGSNLGGAFAAAKSSISADFNNLWKNAPGDYSGVVAGVNDMAVDPGFRGAGDFHLVSTSPLIDAGDSLRVLFAADVDFDGDPRMLEGRRRGRAARVDIGADEASSVQLKVTSGAARIGTTMRMQARGPAGLQVTALSFSQGRVPIAVLGTFLLGPALEILSVGPSGTGPTLPIPNTTSLRGLSFYVQAAVFPTDTPGAGQLTKRLNLTIF